jgi:hypothetical protein
MSFGDQRPRQPLLGRLDVQAVQEAADRAQVEIGIAPLQLADRLEAVISIASTSSASKGGQRPAGAEGAVAQMAPARPAIWPNSAGLSLR